jgi:carbonic anhydrase
MLSPDEALQQLIEGNARSASDRMLHPNRTIERREAIIAQQNPFAIIVGCADSRVPPEIIFDQGLGDLFIVRVAGNVVGQIELDSITFAAKYLGASLILVLGHQNCGAITAVLNGNTEGIEGIANLINPAFKGHCDLCVESAVKANISYVVNSISSSDSLSSMAQQGHLKVVGGYYDLSTGLVTLLS